MSSETTTGAESSGDSAVERRSLRKTEFAALSAELESKCQSFVVESKIVDKRDIGGGRVKLRYALFDFEVGSSSEYRKDGNLEFYTACNLEKRESFFGDEIVKKWLKIFWSTFRSVRKTGEVNASEFVSVHVAMAKALWDPEDWDEEDVSDLVRAEWMREHDGEVKGTMNEETFRRSLFELVDTWSTSVQLLEYRSFLQKLYLRVTGSANGKDDQKLEENQEKHRSLRDHVQLYVKRISKLNDIAMAIALKTKAIAEQKIKALNEANKFKIIRSDSRANLSKLQAIKEEPDNHKRKKSLIDLVSAHGNNMTSSSSLASSHEEDDDDDSSTASEDDPERRKSVSLIESLIKAEELKAAEADAKYREFEQTGRDLAEKEQQLLAEKSTVDKELREAQTHIASAEAEIRAVEMESTDLAESEARRRSWKPLHEVQSMFHDDDTALRRDDDHDDDLRAELKKDDAEEEKKIKDNVVAAAVNDSMRRLTTTNDGQKTPKDQQKVAAIVSHRQKTKDDPVRPESSSDDVVLRPQEKRDVFDEGRWTVWRDMCRGRMPPQDLLPPRTRGGKRLLQPLVEIRPVVADDGISCALLPLLRRHRRLRGPLTSSSTPLLHEPKPRLAKDPRPTTAGPCRGLAAPPWVTKGALSPRATENAWGVGIRW